MHQRKVKLLTECNASKKPKTTDKVPSLKKNEEIKEENTADKVSCVKKVKAES